MKNLNDKDVTIRPNGPNRETGKEHIAKTSHGLQKKDIKEIPNILKNPDTLKVDPTFKNKMNYYGIKRKKYVAIGYIKIITEVKFDGSEEIVTIYFTEKIK